jgi:hypothetical protein
MIRERGIYGKKHYTHCSNRAIEESGQILKESNRTSEESHLYLFTDEEW